MVTNQLPKRIPISLVWRPCSALLLMSALLTACVGRQEALRLTEELETSGAVAKAAIEQIQDSHELTVNVLKDMRGKYILADHERKSRLIQQAMAELDSAYQDQRAEIANDYAETIKDMHSLAANQLTDTRKRIDENPALRNLEQQIFVADGRAREALQLSRSRSDTERLRAAQLSAQALGLSSEYNRIQEEAARNLYDGIYRSLAESITQIDTHRTEFERALQENYQSARQTYENFFEKFPVNIQSIQTGEFNFTSIIISTSRNIDGEVETTVSTEKEPISSTVNLATAQKVLVTDPKSLGPEPRVPTEAYTALIDYHDEVINAAQGLRSNINNNSLSAILLTTTQGLLDGVQEGLTMVFNGEEIPTTTEDLETSGNALLDFIKSTASETFQSQRKEFKTALDMQKEAFKTNIDTQVDTILSDAINTSSLFDLIN